MYSTSFGVSIKSSFFFYKSIVINVNLKTVHLVFLNLTKTYSRGVEFVTLLIEFATYVDFTLPFQQNFINKGY